MRGWLLLLPRSRPSLFSTQYSAQWDLILLAASSLTSRGITTRSHPGAVVDYTSGFCFIPDAGEVKFYSP